MSSMSLGLSEIIDGSSHGADIQGLIDILLLPCGASSECHAQQCATGAGWSFRDFSIVSHVG